MKHKYPKYLRKRYQQKKIDRVMDKIEGKDKWNISYKCTYTTPLTLSHNLRFKIIPGGSWI